MNFRFNHYIKSLSLIVFLGISTGSFAQEAGSLNDNLRQSVEVLKQSRKLYKDIELHILLAKVLKFNKILMEKIQKIESDAVVLDSELVNSGLENHLGSNNLKELNRMASSTQAGPLTVRIGSFTSEDGPLYRLGKAIYPEKYSVKPSNKKNNRYKLIDQETLIELKRLDAEIKALQK